MEDLEVDYSDFEFFEDEEEELDYETKTYLETKVCPACFGTGEDRYEFADCIECWGEGII